MRALFSTEADLVVGVMTGVGSVLLLPELLTKPLRNYARDELLALSLPVSWITLLATDQATAELATALGASCGLCAADAVHLATAVNAGGRTIHHQQKGGLLEVHYRDRHHLSRGPDLVLGA